MDSSHLGGLDWRRSSKCDSGACVEVADLGTLIMIRDSAGDGYLPIAVSRPAWRDFLTGVRAGTFDAC